MWFENQRLLNFVWEQVPARLTFDLAVVHALTYIFHQNSSCMIEYVIKETTAKEMIESNC